MGRTILFPVSFICSTIKTVCFTSICTSPHIFCHCPTAITAFHKTSEDIFVCLQIQLSCPFFQKGLRLFPCFLIYNRFMGVFNNDPIFFWHFLLLASHALVFRTLYHISHIHFPVKNTVDCGIRPIRCAFQTVTVFVILTIYLFIFCRTQNTLCVQQFCDSLFPISLYI